MQSTMHRTIGCSALRAELAMARIALTMLITSEPRQIEPKLLHVARLNAPHVGLCGMAVGARKYQLASTPAEVTCTTCHGMGKGIDVHHMRRRVSTPARSGHVTRAHSSRVHAEAARV